ncbi:MAG: NADPH-dependent glutamate synthase [Bacilli bacterium]|nr:NADPH-dependent glutamate synthase [Bacilli bacterium]
MERTKMRLLDKKSRINNFKEVALGFNDEEALMEASRCLQCANPQCVKGCPVGIKIPEFIAAILNGNMEDAYKVINSSSSLPAVCGRVCPQEKQCESKCIRGFKGDAIAIGALERYVADYALEHKLSSLKKANKRGKKIAIVGSGPSGLTCAGELAKLGYEVTVYEALHKAGGVLVYGIPEFRLPKKIVEQEIDALKKLGVRFILNAPIGKALTIDELRDENDAVYIASGAGLPKFMGIENENANGVFSANEVLTRINLMESYKDNANTPLYLGEKIIVVGGGNVACDAARSLRRFGKNVTLMYRRTKLELPARQEEVEHLLEEGIELLELTNPIKVVVDDEFNVSGLEVVSMELTEKDESGRRGVKALENSNTIVDCDMVVMALGTSPNPLSTLESNIKKDDKNLIIVDGTKTSDDLVFAGGDVVTGAATVILAMEAGKKAALEIVEKLS